MIIQLSSGMGPIECRAAVGGIYRALCTEYPDITMITCRKGEAEGTYSSILFSTEENLANLEGTIEWICKSPYRPGHKRKNWFIDSSIIPLPDETDVNVNESDLRIEHFHAGGHGGQNVNKVETGVRVTHLPTGITVTSTTERSQFLNKKDAICKLAAVLKQLNADEKSRHKKHAWSKHAGIVRGNPVRVYKGEDFKLMKDNTLSNLDLTNPDL